MNRLAANFGAILLSVVLAVAVWVIAVQDQNPFVTGDFPTPVPVSLEGLGPGLSVLGEPVSEAVLSIRAPRQVWDENLRGSDFVVQANLSGLEAGRHDVALLADHPNEEVEILAVKPDSLVITLDNIVSRTLPIQVDIVGEPAFGYEWRSIVVTPTAAVVTGPSTLVNQVVTAGVTVSLRSTRTSIERQQLVTLRNSNSEPVNTVRVDPAVVQVTVTIAQRPGYKDFSVRVPYSGTLSMGYHITGIAVNPSLVTLRGSPEAFDQLPGYVETYPVNIDGATGDINTQLALDIPENLSAVGLSSVGVRIAIEPLVDSRSFEVEPVVRGLGPDLIRSVPLRTVSLLVSGPLPTLQGLNSGNIQVILDLAGLGPGVHSVPLNPVLPEGVQVISILPESVEITISPAPLPTRELPRFPQR